MTKKKNGRFVKTAFYVFRRTFWRILLGKKETFEKIVFLNHFRTLTEKTFGVLTKKNRQCCNKWALRIQRNILEVINLGRIYNFPPFPVFEQKFFGLLAIVSSRLIKIAFNVSTGMFWGFYEKFTFSSSFFHYEQKYESTFGGKLLVWLSNC